MRIKNITIITAQGVKTYEAGETLNAETISRIVEQDLYINGDPFTFYVGYNEQNEMLFKTNAINPIVVEYFK